MPEWVDRRIGIVVMVLVALLALRMVGGLRSRGAQPFTLKALSWLIALSVGFNLAGVLPGSAADLAVVRTLAILLVASVVAAALGPKLAQSSWRSRIHPVVPQVAGWIAIAGILRADGSLFPLLLSGFLPFAQIQAGRTAFHLLLIALAVAMLVKEIRWSTPEQIEEKRRAERPNNIHAFRLVLATGVVVHHACHFASLYHPWPSRADPGWVASFLCLAGLLIPNSRATSRNAGGFAMKRVLRVYPAMIFGFALCFAFLGWETLRGFVAQTYLVGQIGGYSTITVEEICYAGLMILWACGGYMKDGVKRSGVIWAGFILSIGFLLLVDWLQRHSSLQIGAYYHYFATLPQFFFLGNLFWVYEERAKRIPTWIYAGVFLAALAVPRTPFPALDHVVDLLRVSGLFGAFVYSRPVLSWVQRYGDPSYSLFLYHYFVMEKLSSVYHLSFWPLFTLSYGITLALAYASWFAIEEPMLMLKKYFQKPPPLRHPMLAAEHPLRPAEATK